MENPHMDGGINNKVGRKGRKNERELRRHLRRIRNELGDSEYKDFLKENGITWEESSEEDVELKRATSSALKWLKEGNELDMNIYNLQERMILSENITSFLRDLRKGVGPDRYKELLMENGIEWERSEHHGVDTMRATMAAKEWMKSGKTITTEHDKESSHTH